MSLWEIILIGVGLSMDAFAVSMCKGLAMRKFNAGHALIIGAYFGGFQALMPTVGWLLGRSFEGIIKSVDHWVAFGLLAIIGGKMVYDSLHESEDESEAESNPGIDHHEMLLLAVATSIDALAVGITFAFLSVNIVPAATAIGLTTFTISFAGVAIGNKFGDRFRDKAQLAGGIVLIAIGTKILIEHLIGE